MDRTTLMITLGRGQWIALVAAAILAAITFARVSAAVTVTSFTAQAQTAQIVLNWKTASEVSNVGFNIYRSTSPSGPWTTKLNTNIIPACPGCPLGASYSYNDTSAAKGQTLYYRLESVDRNTATQSFGPASAQIAQAGVTATATAASTGIATPTRTGTVPLAVTSTATPVPGTATATVYSSPTPLGTLPSTETPFPTRIAYVVGQPTLTPVPQANVKGAPPKNNSEVPPPVVNPSSAQAQNDSPMVASVPDEPSSAAEGTLPDAVAPQRAIPGPIALGLIALAGILAVTGLSFGAVSFYFIVRRFIR